MEDAKTEPVNEVEKIRQERETIKAENDSYEAELLRAEKLRAQRNMGGKALIKQEEPVKVESPKDYASKVLKGEISGNK